MSMTYIKIIFSVLLTACLVGSAGASEASAENESPYPMQIANESAK